MKKASVLLSIVSGGAIAFLFTLTGTALSALLIKGTVLSEKMLGFIFVALKLASTASGVMYTCFRLRKKGALCGVAVSLIYKLLCVVFSFVLGQADISLAAAFDAFLTCFAGAICGVIGVNVFVRER